MGSEGRLFSHIGNNGGVFKTRTEIDTATGD
jgi:hypothetical protein